MLKCIEPLPFGQNAIGCNRLSGLILWDVFCCPPGAKQFLTPCQQLLEVDLAHQLIVELEIWEAVEWPPPEQVGLDRREGR